MVIDSVYRQSVTGIVETARLALRKIEEFDLDDLVALDSDPLVMKYLSGGVPTPLSVYVGPDGLLAKMRRWSDERFGFFAAEVEGQFIGWFHLRPSVFEPEIMELGYRLLRAHWGVGYATEGGRALCRLAFDDLGQDRVDACALPENLASITVLKKCGMSYVGDGIHPRMPATVARFLVTRDEFSEGFPTK
jgi:RimJ/RimL family protein N-acetyltransferase